MSVVKSKRGEGQLVVITKCNELASHTIHICSNEKVFPKHYRWCITNKIVDATLDINNYVNMANSVYVSDSSDYTLRKTYQTKALAATYSLLSMMDLAYRTFGMESSKIEYWTSLAYDAQNLIRKWRKSDADRYKNF